MQAYLVQATTYGAVGSVRSPFDGARSLSHHSPPLYDFPDKCLGLPSVIPVVTVLGWLALRSYPAVVRNLLPNEHHRPAKQLAHLHRCFPCHGQVALVA